MEKTDQPRKYKSKNKYKTPKDKKGMTEQSYRFRRVLGEILKYLKTIPHKSSFLKCQKEFGEQLTELVQRGFTWGYTYSIPTHESDFKSLEKKEWAAIRAIVRKQEYDGANPDY